MLYLRRASLRLPTRHPIRRAVSQNPFLDSKLLLRPLNLFDPLVEKTSAAWGHTVPILRHIRAKICIETRLAPIVYNPGVRRFILASHM